MNLRIIFFKSPGVPTPRPGILGPQVRKQTQNTHLHVTNKEKKFLRIFASNYYYASFFQSLISVLSIDLFYIYEDSGLPLILLGYYVTGFYKSLSKIFRGQKLFALKMLN